MGGLGETQGRLRHCIGDVTQMGTDAIVILILIADAVSAGQWAAVSNYIASTSSSNSSHAG